mmetsp:Transcript_48842/g.80997  ORF Transcript_48842/g.80997 Transcript_48842/m.80997 type:complete len:482 (+) Transcript_48842:56-1501(+)
MAEAAGTGPKELEDWKRLLDGRFEVRRSNVLGRGAYAVVRRGRDLQKGKPIAVKFYVEDGDDGTYGSPSEESLAIFRRGIDALEVLHRATPEEVRKRLCVVEGASKEGGTPASRNESRRSFVGFDAGTEAAEVALQDMRLHPQQLFVEVLGYSRGVDGRPGGVDGMCYLATDFGLETLEQYVADAREFEKPPSPVQVRAILLQLTQAVAALHAFGFAHLDIKPSNVMRFKSGKSSVWKLIDMDGLLPAQSTVDPLTVPFTPLYCPPELARAISKRHPQITVSRWMDVWCIGMSILDCILPQSLLQERFKQDGRDAFLDWLGSMLELDIPEEVVRFDPGLANILGSQVLAPVAGHRASVLELLLALQQPEEQSAPKPPVREATEGAAADGSLQAKALPPEAATEVAPAAERATPEPSKGQISMQAYSQKLFPLLVPVIQHLLSSEAENVEAEALRFLEAQRKDREVVADAIAGSQAPGPGRV